MFLAIYNQVRPLWFIFTHFWNSFVKCLSRSVFFSNTLNINTKTVFWSSIGSWSRHINSSQFFVTFFSKLCEISMILFIPDFSLLNFEIFCRIMVLSTIQFKFQSFPFYFIKEKSSFQEKCSIVWKISTFSGSKEKQMANNRNAAANKTYLISHTKIWNHGCNEYTVHIMVFPVFSV